MSEQTMALLPDGGAGEPHPHRRIDTEPLFAIIPALSSRSQIFEFKHLSDDHLRAIIGRALADRDRGLGAMTVSLADEARELIVRRSNGAARRALNALELGVPSTPPGPDGTIVFDLAAAEESIQAKALTYDEDEHYDTISAFIKSMRGSDPDAALYWMAKMLTAGEDALFVARRIVIGACPARERRRQVTHRPLTPWQAWQHTL